MRKSLKASMLLLSLLSVMLVISGCGKKSTVTTIKVGVPNDSYPFGYQKNNKLDGYDVAVLKAVDKKLTGYTFKYEGSDFATSLSNLGSNKVKLAAFEYEVNAERKKKFVYGDVGYSIWDTYIVTTSGSKALNSFSELKGKKLYVTTSTNQAVAAQTYLKKHPNAFKIVYGSYTNEQIVQALTSGAVDATLAPKYSVDSWNRKFHKNLKIGSKAVHHSDAYVLFNKSTDKSFMKKVNKAMKQLKADGTLKKLSQKYLKGNYVPK